MDGGGVKWERRERKDRKTFEIQAVTLRLVVGITVAFVVQRDLPCMARQSFAC
jgi:hypothetical protein